MALAVVCWAVVAAQAVAQMVGGVNYKIVSKTDKTAEVTWLEGDDDDPFADDPVYTGEVVIPEKVKIAGVDYTVVGVGKMAFADANLKKTHLAINRQVCGLGQFLGRNSSRQIRYP
ncbi:MAG: hypothetical protein L6U16_07700 [Porphyromonadaceae bacterium]|nr:MAG: hypothetical protein L6U16_07700 [Porphyromonadaceae bacterium]